MNESSCHRSLWSFVTAVSLSLVLGVYSAGTAMAQTTLVEATCSARETPCPAPAAAQQMIAVPMGIGSIEQVEVVRNHPYQAQATTEIKQTLADGSHILHSFTASVARDREGRTVRTQKLPSLGLWTASSDDGSSATLTSIFDPVADTHIDFTSNSRVAHVTTGNVSGVTMAKPNVSAKTSRRDTQQASTSAPVVVSGAGFLSGGTIATSQVAEQNPGPVVLQLRPEGKASNTELLGSKTIEDTEVTGTRSTTIIPKGTIGNDRDLTITHETWYSPELRLVLISTQDDPRFGQTTYSLTNIKRGEPSRALFQIPAGYRVVLPPSSMQTR